MVRPVYQETQIFFIYKCEEHINKFGEIWSPSSELMTCTNVSNLPALKFDPSDQLFIKYDIFEVTVISPPSGDPIDIIAQYYEHHSISYISQITNHCPWNRDLPVRNITNLWILFIGRE